MVRARLIALVLLPLLASCYGTTQTPTVTFQRMDVRDVTFGQISVAFVFSVSNPNRIAVDLAQLSYELTVEGHAFAQGSSTVPLHVPARGIARAIVPVTIPYAGLGQPLDAVFARTSVAYSLSATLGFGTPMGVLSTPVSTSGQLPVPQLPLVQFGSAGVRHVGLTGADLAVVINVRNTNAFSIPLGNFTYAVTLAGAPLVSSLAPIGTIGPSAVTPVQLGAHIDFLAVGLGVVRAIKSGGATIAFDGTLDLGSYEVPVHVTGKL